MKYHNKFIIIDPDSEEIPSLGLQTVDLQCPCCDRRIVVPVMPEFTDWKSVADEYKGLAQMQFDRFNQIMKDLEVMHPHNPVVKYFENEMKAVFKDWESKF